MPTALHGDCVCCLAKADDPDPEEAVLILLAMCSELGATIESVVRDLCFEHRRRLHDLGLRLAAERKT